MGRTYNIKSQTGVADCDAADTMAGSLFTSPCDAARNFVGLHHPGYEFLGSVRYEEPYLHRGEAVNHQTRMGLVVWVQEVA